MRNSSGRILTTHTGSLPRPQGLTELVFRKQEGRGVDPETFEAAAIEATNDAVFATFAGFGMVDPEVARMKLAALAQGAAEASEQL